jgi:integrase
MKQDLKQLHQIRHEDRRVLNKEQLAIIFGAIATHSPTAFLKKRNMAMFSVLLHCGLRRNELIHLKVFDVDLQRKELLVRAATSKPQKDRLLPLNSMVLLHLTSYLEERKKRPYGWPFLFVSPINDHLLNPEGLHHLLARWKDVSGVPFPLHQLRTSRATD